MTTYDSSQIKHGDQVGGYTIERLLGRGAMGCVFLAHKTSSSRSPSPPDRERYAVKILNPLTGFGTLFIEREWNALKSIAHPNVVRAFEMGECARLQVPYIVMELLNGRTLEQRILDEGRLDYQSALAFLQMLSSGLDHVHQFGIIHRDVKPSNIFLEQRGDGATNLKLIDFGIAKLHAGRASVLAGTPGWSAPEQGGHETTTIGVQTDVYPLAAIVYYMLTGKIYADEPAPSALTPSQRVSRRGILIHPSFDAWFSICRQQLLQNRYASAGAAFEALRRVISYGSASPMPWLHGPSEEERFSKRSFFWNPSELVPKKIPGPDNCADCTMHRIQCPACRRLIDSFGDRCVAHRAFIAPRFEDLWYCPICGTRLRKTDDYSFHGAAPPALDDNPLERPRPTQQYCYSGDSLYCILSGAPLQFAPRIDLTVGATAPEVAVAQGEHLLIASGCDVVVTHSDVVPDGLTWPLCQWTSTSVGKHEVSGCGVTRCFRVPLQTRWTDWHIGSRLPDDSIKESLRAYLAPMPRLFLRTDREESELRDDAKIVEYSEESAALELAIQLPAPLPWVPEQLVTLFIDRIAIESEDHALPITRKHRGPSMIELAVKLSRGRHASLKLQPWCRQLPQLQPVRRTVPTLKLEYRDCRGEWLPLENQTSLRVIRPPGWHVSEQLETTLRLRTEQTTVDLPPGDLDVRRDGASLPTERSIRSSNEASWRLALPTDSLSPIRTEVDVAYGTAFRCRFYLDPLASTFKILPDGLCDEVPGTEGQDWFLSGDIECLRLQGAPAQAFPHIARIAVGDRVSEIMLTSTGHWTLSLPRRIASTSPTSVRVDLLHRGGLLKIARTISFRPFPIDFVSLVYQSGVTPELHATTADPELGVASRPNLAVDRLVPFSIELTNDWDFAISIGPQVIRAPSGFFEVTVPKRYTVTAKSKASLQITLRPLVVSDRALWDFALPLEFPRFARVRCLVVVQAVLQRDLTDRIYYDYGTSYTAVCGNYGLQRNYLKESTEAHFIRSRAVAHWRRDDLERPDPSYLQAPCVDAVLDAEEYKKRHIGFSILHDIKTHFRTGQRPVIAINTPGGRRVPGLPSLYQPRDIAETYRRIQESLADFVMDCLSTVPVEVVTALPIVLRGSRRADAHASLRDAFSKACKSRGYTEPMVDANLDESTAAAMTTLLERVEGVMDEDEHVLVIDVGGGTTDITLYRVSRGKSGDRAASVDCIGFDGLGLGGTWVTQRVASLLRQRILDELARDECSVHLPLPADRSHLDREHDRAIAVINGMVLERLAEDAKRTAMSRDIWRASERDLQAAHQLTGLSPDGRRVTVPIDVLEFRYQDLLADVEYKRFLDEIIRRAQHAGNLSCAREYEPPNITRVVLAGQASQCRQLESELQSRFRATKIVSAGARDVPDPSVGRKLAVLDGLRVYCERVRGRELEGGFRVGGLDKVVMCPVGVHGPPGTVLPRFHPLNVPATLCDEVDVIEFGGKKRRQLLPMALREQSGAAPDKIATTHSVIYLAETIQLRWDKSLGEKENLELRRRFRYCLWVDSHDVLRGSMYEHWDREQVIRGVSFTSCSKHPLLLLLKELVRRGRTPVKILELDSLASGSTPITVVASDGAIWTTCSVETEEFRKSSSVWYDPFMDLGPGEEQFVFAVNDTSTERRKSILIGSGVPNRQTTYWRLAEELIRRISGKRFFSLPVVCGVKLPTGDQKTIITAIALGDVDSSGAPIAGAPAWCEMWLVSGDVPKGRDFEEPSQWWLPCLSPDGSEQEMHEFEGYRQEVTRVWLDRDHSFDRSPPNGD